MKWLQNYYTCLLHKLLYTCHIVFVCSQVHKAYMKAEMIPDESVVDEILEMIEEDLEEPEIDFADGTQLIKFKLDNGHG